MTFWSVAAAIFAVVAALVVLAFRRGGAGGDAASPDIALYRDQLAEVDRDLARGVIEADEAVRLRTEIARRILEADRAAAAGQGAGAEWGGRTALGIAAALLCLGAAFLLYPRLGAPGYPDLPLAARIEAARVAAATRPAQAEMERMVPPASIPDPDPEHAALMIRLREAVAARPADLEGQQLLARNEGALGNYAAAARAQAEVIRIRGAQADAADHAALGDFMVRAAGGRVSPEAEAALARALALDAREPVARFHMGLGLAQNGRPDLAFRLWRGLLDDSAPNAPWVPALRRDLPGLAWLAGVDYALPPEVALPRPSAGDIADAAALSPEERAEMVQGMVDGLARRLAAEGGPAEDWARLVSALGVLGQRERAGAILAEARGVFAGRPEDLARIEAAAGAGQ